MGVSTMSNPAGTEVFREPCPTCGSESVDVGSVQQMSDHEVATVFCKNCPTLFEVEGGGVVNIVQEGSA